MAEKRATFILRRFFSLGFSKWRWLRTSFKVPSRSMRFFKRRNAFSTDSPFFNLISVKLDSLPSRRLGAQNPTIMARPALSSEGPKARRLPQTCQCGFSKMRGKLLQINDGGKFPDSEK